MYQINKCQTILTINYYVQDNGIFVISYNYPPSIIYRPHAIEPNQEVYIWYTLCFATIAAIFTRVQY